MSQHHSEFPNYQSGLNYALSDEPILLNGMKVIFDQSASVYPVSLQPRFSELGEQYSQAKKLTSSKIGDWENTAVEKFYGMQDLLTDAHINLLNAIAEYLKKDKLFIKDNKNRSLKEEQTKELDKLIDKVNKNLKRDLIERVFNDKSYDEIKLLLNKLRVENSPDYAEYNNAINVFLQLFLKLLKKESKQENNNNSSGQIVSNRNQRQRQHRNQRQQQLFLNEELNQTEAFVIGKDNKNGASIFNYKRDENTGSIDVLTKKTSFFKTSNVVTYAKLRKPIIINLQNEVKNENGKGEYVFCKYIDENGVTHSGYIKKDLVLFDRKNIIDYLISNSEKYPDYFKLFYDYAKRQFCQENIDFLLMVKTIKNATNTTDIDKLIKEINSMFLRKESSKELNLQNKEYKNYLLTFYEDYKKTIKEFNSKFIKFREYKTKILRLLEPLENEVIKNISDTYSNFERSD